MTNNRPFRFAAAIGRAESGDEFLDLVRRSEAQGYTDFALYDHFTAGWAPISALTAAAMVAPSIRVCCTVFDNDFRHPAVLAKEMATLDKLTNGRVDVGIGAGWSKIDYDQTGMSYDRPGVRIDRMEESLAIMKALWDDGPANFQGDHYTITEMEGHPKPAQDPLPIFIGGGGKRMLSIAAREANIIGVHLQLGPTGSEVEADESRRMLREKIGWIQDAAGARYRQIELALLLFAATVVDSEAEKIAEAERISAAGGTAKLSPEAILASPYHLIGSASEISEEILELRESFGITHFSISRSDLNGFAPVVTKLSGS